MRLPTDRARTLAGFMGGLLLATAGAAQTVTGAPATPQAQAPAAAPLAPLPDLELPAGTVVAAPMTPAAEGIAAEANALANLKRETSFKQQQLLRDSTDAEIEQVAVRRGQSTGTRKDLPELVGIVGGGDNLIAEFLVGAALLEVRPGDWVTSDWRLTQIHRNGVSLRSRGGRSETLLFGQSAPSGTLEGMQPAAYSQRQPVSQMPVR